MRKKERNKRERYSNSRDNFLNVVNGKEGMMLLTPD
jgi:hypothetical protein